MIVELGLFSAILAWLLSFVTAVLAIPGSLRQSPALTKVAMPGARAQCLLVTVALLTLGYAFLTNDFSVIYVASNSNTSLPAVYRAAAVWGGHEGSMLLWTWLLTVWMAAVTVFGRAVPEAVRARVVGIMSVIVCAFLAFLLLTSNPFLRIVPPLVDGHDLNPLLQDPGMVIHPPMLYMGYVGFSVTFAFVVAALLSRQLNADWARWCRPWALAAWSFLTVGIMLGSAWAYYELGWGGWWFWDPVENASLMPWLVGTALIHSLIVTEKRGLFSQWTALLAIGTFSLSLIGTFLVRSGVVTSVHAFASDPTRGVFMLGILGGITGAALLTFAWGAPAIRSRGQFDAASRETLMLSNNVLLMSATGAVLLGTLYPMVLDTFGADKISVGPPYFDTVFVPLMAPALFLMGLGPVARWRAQRLPELGRRLRWAFVVGIVAALASLRASAWSPLVALGLFLAAWVFAGVVTACVARLRAAQGNLARRCASVPRAVWGMWIAHAGVAAFVLGVTVVKAYEVQTDVTLRAGESATVMSYRFTLAGLSNVDGPNYRAVRATIDVTRDGKAVTQLHPERRTYRSQEMPMTEAAIDYGVFRDLYVALANSPAPDRWLLRLQVKPMVRWIWAGCVLMALGGLVALTDRRYFVRRRAHAHDTPAAQASPAPSPAAAATLAAAHEGDRP
jgi:cytochrome c-type biogenesis protein CcmF